MPARINHPGPFSVPTPATPRTAPASPSTPVGRGGGVTAPGDSFATSGPGASVFPAGPRRWGSWAWQSNASTALPVLDALLASQKQAGATELYFNAYPLLGREAFLEAAVGRSVALGLAPQLLLGSPDWADAATRPWLESAIIAPLKALRARVPEATAPRLAVHLDVEPHATGPLTPEKLRGYLDTLDWLGAQLGPGFALQVDVPVWYRGQVVDGKDVLDEVLARVDGVTLMAYERDLSQVLADVAPALAQAAAQGKEALVAVEVGPQHRQAGLGTQADVRRFLAQLDQALAGTPGYGGCALHDLDTLKLLPPS